tara:strand:+ start:5535 stop:5780 length:246 start_codon:yes stop_codon:yes gene_type:complete
MTKRYDVKIPSVIHRTVVNEEIIFQGKRIMRERIVKTIVLPKIIRDDLGFEMMFGFKRTANNLNSQSSGIESRAIEYSGNN